jgi:broad specificity phosphatase PhoE
VTTLVLVRHGQASFGARNYDQLSALGIRQSQVLGEYWSQLNARFDAVYSGTLSRQLDTARHALTLLPETASLVTHPAFNEYDFEAILKTYIPMVLEQQADSATQKALYQNPKNFQHAFEKAIGYWIEDRPHTQPPFESWGKFTSRITQGLREVSTSDKKTVVAFTSGGVIAVALREALGLSEEMTFRMNWRIHNASVHRFKVGRNGLSLLSYNNVAHLELKSDDSLLTFR